MPAKSAKDKKHVGFLPWVPNTLCMIKAIQSTDYASGAVENSMAIGGTRVPGLLMNALLATVASRVVCKDSAVSLRQ